jgi:hypothetical protein
MRGHRGLLLGRPDFLPHEVGKLDEKDLLRKDHAEVIQRHSIGNQVEGVDGQSEVRTVGQGDDFRRRRKAAAAKIMACEKPACRAADIRGSLCRLTLMAVQGSTVMVVPNESP